MLVLVSMLAQLRFLVADVCKGDCLRRLSANSKLSCICDFC